MLSAESNSGKTTKCKPIKADTESLRDMAKRPINIKNELAKSSFY